MWAQTLLGVGGLAAVWVLGVDVYGFLLQRQSLQGVTFDLQQAIDAYPGLVDISLRISEGTTGVCAIAFVLWLYRAAKVAEAVAPNQQRLRSGWAVGSWFIPLACVVMPSILIRDIWKASHPLPWPAPRLRMRLLTAWWATWLLGLGQFAFGNFYLGTPGDVFLGSLASPFLWQAVGSGVARAASAALAVLVVRQLTAMQRTRIPQGPIFLRPATSGPQVQDA